MSWRVFVGLLLLLPGSSPAEEPKPAPSPWRVRVSVKIVALPPEKATPLLLRLQGPQQDKTALADLDEMIARGEAELVDWPQTVTTVQGHACSENVEELRYAAEDDRPIFWDSRPPPGYGVWNAASRWGFTTPTGFETRNCGPVLECVLESITRDGGLLSCVVVASLEKLTKFVSFPGNADANGTVAQLSQPWVARSRTGTQLTLRSGEPLLLGSFPQATEPPRVLLYILTATATKVADDR